METLTIDTGIGTATLSRSEEGQNWYLFSGNLTELSRMADEAGYNYQRTRIQLADWIARNKELFVIEEEKEVTTDELWAEANNEEKYESEIVNLLKDNKISRKSEKEFVVEGGILYTIREWNMYSPNDNLNNAINQGRAISIVPCHI